MHHLQACPSTMQMLFCQRKDNVPIRLFPDNNLGQKDGIMLPQLCVESPDKLSSIDAFLGFSKQSPT